MNHKLAGEKLARYREYQQKYRKMRWSEGVSPEMEKEAEARVEPKFQRFTLANSINRRIRISIDTVPCTPNKYLNKHQKYLYKIERDRLFKILQRISIIFGPKVPFRKARVKILMWRKYPLRDEKNSEASTKPLVDCLKRWITLPCPNKKNAWTWEEIYGRPGLGWFEDDNDAVFEEQSVQEKGPSDKTVIIIEEME